MTLFAVTVLYRSDVRVPEVLAEEAPVHPGPAFPVFARTPEDAALNTLRMLATPLRAGTGIRPGDLIEVRLPGQPGPSRTFEVGLLGLVPVTPVTTEGGKR